MNKRPACFLVLVVLTSLVSFGSVSQSNSRHRIGSAVKRSTSRAALGKWSARMKSANPPTTNIGFLSAPQIPAGGSDDTTYFPPVIGDFNGDGIKDAATVVKTAGGKYQISVALGNGNGTFQAPKLTLTTASAADPIWVGSLNPGVDACDDLVMGHNTSPAATFEVWISNCDGTFTSKGSTALGASSAISWGTLYPDPGVGHPLDVIIVDGIGNGRNGNIWTAIGNGDGTFKKPTSAAFSGKLAANSPVAFADFDGDGVLDFAGSDATTNQVKVYYGGALNTPVPLTTPDGLYNSCFSGAGVLTTSGHPDIVSANGLCGGVNPLANNVTVYVNNETNSHRTFQAGAYYPVGIAPDSLSIADVNGDGNNDVITTDGQSGDLRVLPGDGTGKLGNASVGYATGGDVQTQALVADFDNDGKNDLLISDLEFNFIYYEGYGDGSFRSSLNYYAAPVGGGFEPYGVDIASGDFNGDGIPDLVIGNAKVTPLKGVSGVTVFLSNPDGSMQQGANYTSNANPSALQYVAVADFNGDGKLDIAAADSVNGVVQIFNGKGDGTFTVGATYATGTVGSRSALGLVAGDFNGDGKPDLAVVNNYSGTTTDVGILINNGSGFNSVVNYPVSASVLATNITTADLNGDKKLDLVVPLYGTNATPGTAVAVLLGNGNGTFTNGSPATVGNNPLYAAVGDLNGDGIPDLAVTIDDQTTHNQGIAVAFGKGDGTFQAATLVPSTLQPPLDFPNPGYVKMLDLNRDGHLDLLYTNSEFGTVGVLYNQGTGTFFDPVEYVAGHQAFGIALADVNGDGAVDVVSTGNAPAFSGVNVLLNASGNTTTLQSSAPHGAPPGTNITFTATVTGSKVRGVTAVPTGSVTFSDGGKPMGSPVPLSSDVATFSTSTLTSASHNITAQYSGDANYVTTSAQLTQVVGQPDYKLAANPTSQTVNPGSSASYTITLTPSNGYDGTVTIKCPSSLPTGVSCNTPTIGPGQTQATLTINTQGPTGALVAPADVNPHRGDSNLWASLSSLGIVGMVLAGDWKKRNRRRLAIVLTVLAVVMILALVGCGGGSSSSGGGGGGGTPAGTYQVQVAATGTAGTNGGNTAPHPLDLTLVVQ